MRRLLFAAPLVLLALGEPAMADESTTDRPDAETSAAPLTDPLAAASVSECVVLSQEDVAAGIAFTFTNGCEEPIRCDFRWSLVCDADATTGASPRESAQSFRLQSGASRTYVADSAACGDDGWMIGDDVWDCVER